MPEKGASAPRRIGVGYQVKSAVRSRDWSQSDLDERLHAWFVTSDRIREIPRLDIIQDKVGEKSLS